MVTTGKLRLRKGTCSRSKAGSRGLIPNPCPHQSRAPAVGGQQFIPSRSFLSGKLCLGPTPPHPQVLALPLGWGQPCRRVE